VTGAGGGQGWSVALSADGSTAIVGAPFDATDIHIHGAAWVFTRSNGVWAQQAKLVGTGAIGFPWQGSSVALCADGSTAIVGGPFDHQVCAPICSSIGAAWVFTRSNGVWTQQGNKLVGSGAVTAAGQGASVALSGDGKTAVVGGPNDNLTQCPPCTAVGAAWVFARSNGVWTQQGNKLVGTGAIGRARQGSSVALSGDGNTAIIGGPSDNNGSGAARVFVRP
jgi:hypothetical protein